MAKLAPRIKPDLSPFALWLARLGLLIAFGISVFLAWSSFRGGAAPGCGPDSDCDKVLSSRWAYVFGLPVSVFALPVYVGMLVLLARKKLEWRILMPLAVIVLGAALWFAGLQAFALRAFCKYCMTAHAAGAAAALTLVRFNPLQTKPSARSFGIGALAALAFIGAQFASPPPAPSILRTAHNEAVVHSATPATDPTFSVVDGQFTLNLTQVPVAGPLSAPKKLVKLFDYTCHHCRDLHHLLTAFRKRHADELAVISLPVPLDSACNPAMRSTPRDHVNACEYARIGLAVFYARPEKFEEFSDWIFAPPRPPPLDQARAHAEELAGGRDFREALASPRVNEQVRLDIDIYLASSRAARNSRMPQLLFERGGSIGAIETAEQLERILAENLGLGNAPALPAEKGAH